MFRSYYFQKEASLSLLLVFTITIFHYYSKEEFFLIGTEIPETESLRREVFDFICETERSQQENYATKIIHSRNWIFSKNIKLSWVDLMTIFLRKYRHVKYYSRCNK